MTKHCHHERHDDDDDDHDQNGDHGHNLPPVKINARLDPSAEKANGDALFGSGNPGKGWLVEDNGHFEVGQMHNFRTGDTIQPFAVDHGVFIFNGPAGQQVVDPSHNVSAAQANRGAVNEAWSFDTGAHGPGGLTQQQFLASGGKEEVKIDLDPSAGFKWLTLDAKYDPIHNPGGSHVVWETHDNTFFAKGTIVVSDDAGNAFTTQNSTNLAFFQSLIDVDPHHKGIQTGGVSPTGTYDFETSVTDSHNHVILDVHSQYHLG